MFLTNTYKTLILYSLIPFTLASSITSEYTTGQQNPDYCSSIAVLSKWDNPVDVYTGIAYANNNKGPFTIVGSHSTNQFLNFEVLNLDSSYKDVYWFAISTNGFDMGTGRDAATIENGNLISGDNKISMTDDKVLIGFTWDNGGLPQGNGNVHELTTATCATRDDTISSGPISSSASVVSS